MFGKTRIPTETPLQVREALGRGEIILIDVREPAEYAAERIHGALLFPRYPSCAVCRERSWNICAN